jgi:hypothetical protein
MITALAPRSCVFSAFRPKSQVPRWITATFPVRSGNSAEVQPALEVLAVVVGSLKPITAIGVPAGTVAEPEPSIVA